MRNTLAGSSAISWRSEEDYVLARLAVAMGLLDGDAVQVGLRAQADALGAGHALGLGQALVRSGRLAPAALIELQAELAKYLCRCPTCGTARYLVPGPEPRSEPCRCGGAIPVPAASSSLTRSAITRRQAAFQHTSGAEAFAQDPFAAAAGRGPRALGQFVLERELARGGMGAVYRARHAETGQVVALKLLLAGKGASAAQVHRFQREARAQMELDHPNIVKIHEVGEWEGVLYLTMDLVEGGDLRRLRDLELPARIGVMAQVARAIEHAHAQGYIHRDLKPGNVLVDTEMRPLVTDFGLAKHLDGQTMLTKDGAVLGTPYYMPPEQALGKVQEIGPASDIYSLGVLLYEVATGALPFEANAAIELYRKICEEPPEPMATHGCLIPELEQIAFKAMEKLPQDRYASAGDLALDLERYLRGEPPLGTQVSSAIRMARSVERHKRSIGFILGLVTVGLTVLIGAILGTRSLLAHLEGEQAVAERREALVGATSRLDQALTAAAGGSASAGRALDGAIEAARALLTVEGPDLAEVARLQERLSEALLARAGSALEARTQSGARAALAAADEVLGDAAAGVELRTRSLLLRARAARRLGDHEVVARSLERLGAEADDDPRVALLRGDLALAEGQAEAALEHFRAAGAAGLATPALLGQGRVLLALGRGEAAEARFREAAEGAAAPARAHAQAAGALLAAGRFSAAGEAFERALEHAPDDRAAARGLLFVARTTGEPLLAREALDRAARRGDAPDVDAAAAEARLALGQDARSLLGGLAGRSPDAALLLADLGAAELAPDPYDHLVDDPAFAEDARPRAARARWRATRGEAEAARADLEALAPALAEVPPDVAPSLDLARVVRDAGWARLALGDAEAAARDARTALRGRPGDLDAALLLARADPSARATAVEAFVREAEALDGPLGRALLVGRLALFRGDASLAQLAQPLLRARLAGDPGLVPLVDLQVRLAALAGEEAGPTPPSVPGQPVLDWATLCPAPTAPEVDPEDRDRAFELASRARAMGKKRDEQSRDRLLKALELDPECQLARWEYPVRHTRLEGESLEAHLDWLRYLRHCPSFAPGLWMRIRTLLMKTALLRRPLAEEFDEVLAVDPDDPLRRTLALMERYFGVLFGDGPIEGKLWRAGDPAALRREVGAILRRDARLCALLWVRAHLGARLGLTASARSDLDLIERLALADTSPTGEGDQRFFRDVYRVWILARIAPRDALEVVEGLDRDPVGVAKRDREHALTLLTKEAGVASIRDDPAFRRFLEEFDAAEGN